MQTVKRKPIANKLFDDSFAVDSKSEIRRKEKASNEMREQLMEEKESSYNSKYELEDDLWYFICDC